MPLATFVTQTFHDLACTVCGCVCDDIAVTVDHGRIVATERLCALGEPWFEAIGSPAEAFAEIDGQSASYHEALDRAADILSSSRAPLIYGLSRSSTAGQRAAVRLADELGGIVDTTASTCHAPSIMAVQSVGESTATLGEVRNRSNVIVYWGSNPLDSHPRHVERFVDAPGQFVPNGRRDRRLIVVDVEPTETTEVADRFVRVDPDGDFELITALRTLVKGKCSVSSASGGVASADIATLADELKGAQYGALFFGLGVTRGSVPHAVVENLLNLVTDLNAHTRFIARRMRIPGDVSGADSVLCWQTGFPFAVNLARGYPRYNPGEYTAGALLERGEVDAVVLVGSEDVRKLSPAALEYLQKVPTIVLDQPRGEISLPATVRFNTAAYGIHRRGTAYRMDEVPIPLHSFLESPLPSDDEVLTAISSHCVGSATR